MEYEREQRFDFESKNEEIVIQMNKLKLELMQSEDRVSQLQEVLKGKEDQITIQRNKVDALEESMQGLRSNFDDIFRKYNEGKVLLENMEDEKDKYLEKLTIAKQELAEASANVSGITIIDAAIKMNFDSLNTWKRR